MSQRFSEYARRERDDYPTPNWVTEAIVPHLKVLGVETVWEPAAGDGGMATALTGGGFGVVATDIKSGTDFLKATRPCDAIVTNPPYGVQGRTAEEFIVRALELTRPHRGSVAMLLKVDFDSGKTRQRLFADCPAWARKLVLLRRILWFESRNGMTPSENHAWFVWSWQHAGPPVIAYGGA